jgi:hypothetical protein
VVPEHSVSWRLDHAIPKHSECRLELPPSRGLKMGPLTPGNTCKYHEAAKRVLVTEYNASTNRLPAFRIFAKLSPLGRIVSRYVSYNNFIYQSGDFHQ